MELLKLATEWAKSEVFSTRFFIYFAVVFLVSSFGFWQLGKTVLAKAYIIPTLLAGVILLTIGLGLFYTNKSRITEFKTAYQKDASAFVESEFIRIEKALDEYRTIVFKAIPFIIIGAALLIAFVDKPNWRASAITVIAMLVVILLIDGTASERIKVYKQELEAVINEN